MATTPTPQNNSNDPQVPGNFPGTVQNPTQVPAPVNPAIDPEVSPPPNDVDPNYIPNPAPVNPAADPEVPPATTEFGGGKRFDAEPVVPTTNQQVPPAQDLGSEPPIDLPQAPATSIDPQIPAAQDLGSEPPIDLPQALPPADPTANNTGFDDFYGDQTYTANRTGTADAPPVTPTASNTGFDDFYGEQTYTVNYTGTADAVPAANTGFDDFYGEQTYTANFTGTADARPVTPTTNSQVPQVPNLFSSISALLSNLFGITPTPVTPTANPQVAQPIPVSLPVVLTPIPIPASTTTPTTTTTTTNNSSGFGDFYGEQTYTANYTGTADAVPAANTGFDDFYGEQTYTTNYTGTADAVPAGNTGFDDFYGEQTYTANLTGTADAVPAGNTGFDDYYGEQTYTVTGTGTADATPVAPANTGFDDFYGEQTYTATATGTADAVAPATNPSVPQSDTRIDGPVNQATFQQANPAAATDYRSYVVDTQNKIVEQQTRELEATQGFPASENQIAVINGAAFGTATVAADIKFKDQIQAADAAQSVPVNTPPPTVAPAPAEGFGPPPNDADPNFISNPAPVSNAIDPEVPQPTAEFGGGKRFAPEAVDDFGPPPNDVDPNFISNPGPVDSTIDPEVPSSANVRVENVFQSELAQKDPALYQQWQGTFAARTEQNIAKEIAATEAVYGRPVTDEEKVSIANSAVFRARNETNAIYQDELQAANAVSVVPTDTPPPTETAPAVDSATNQQVPPPSTSEALIDPDTGEVLGYVDTATGETTDAPPAVSAATNPQVPAAQDLGSEPPIDLPQAPPSTVDPQIPQPDSFPEEGIDFPVAPPAGVDPQIPQPDSFPEEGIDLPAPVESPSPYERFLAQEAAATDAAQAEATARFNAQFEDGGNIIGSSDDPQVNQGDTTDVGEFQAELPPIPDIDTGYGDFYGIEDDVGEFQAEPVDIPNIDTGYDDFYGNEEDVGEFQAEPVDIPDIDTGYDDFYGNEEDVGEFQDLTLEPDAVDSDDTGFGNFSDTGGDGGDLFSGLFGGVKRSAGAVSGGTDPLAGILDGLFGDGPTKPNPKTTLSPAQLAANRQKAAQALAKQQNIINQQRKQANDGDWRVRLRLAGSADYLYNAPSPGILAPLSKSGSDGVIFPYTPQITTAYQAKYNAYELTHSNYKGYFYQGSSVGDISINATFTAQDTKEANYLLAVIHFFRSVTKMFYGQDDSAQRGAPPPLVFLQGLGEYQFNLHPCVVTNFNYTLPADVDYIRALSPNNNGTNLSNRRSLQSGVTPFTNPSVSRLQNAGLPQGGLYTPAAPPTLGTNSPTYVPTKMDIQLTLLAIQTRSQVSKQFSLKEFANGNLIRGGFW
jgi:hypothetical protein